MNDLFFLGKADKTQNDILSKTVTPLEEKHMRRIVEHSLPRERKQLLDGPHFNYY